MMKSRDLLKLPSGAFVVFVAAVVIVATVLIVELSPWTGIASADSAAATYAHGVVHVTIPYDAARAGSGQLAVELVDPDDQVLGRAERRADVAAGKGTWQEDLKLSKMLRTEDLVWHRLRYRFTYSDGKGGPIEGIESVSQILRQPVIRILGQQSYLAGAAAAVRVVVSDSNGETIGGQGTLRIELAPADKKPQVLFQGALNRRGTVEAQFRYPAGLTGSVPVRYVVETAIGSTEFTQQVKLEDKVSILLTTEKPIYQPGQTIHARALALDRAHHEATSGRALTFEVEDSKGNKVFKKATQTDAYGIASAEFQLADEVNLGTYHLRALMDNNKAETALNVDRYVLPKFKVAVEFGGEAQHGYRPGDHVTGTVRANYFFGKPVDGAGITMKASAMDVAVAEVASAHGRTDRDGAYRFDMVLPNYFAGRPLDTGAARVLIEATVKDTAGHAETKGEPITVTESPIVITAVPEGGKLAPGLENQVFVLTSYADGKPATTTVKVKAPGNAEQTARTDEGGIAVVRLKAGAGAESVKVEARDKDGNQASRTVQLEARDGSDQILLRTERAVYRTGDPLRLKIFSTKERGTAYLDVVKDGQTILTRDVDLVNGQAELSLAVTGDLAGTLDCDAYLFGRDARPVADHRLVFVQPADELKIEATADGETYKPGEDARMRFRVTNSKGEGVQAALGVQVVDEAVFALAEKQPGFAKVFFYLEQEAMKPRYEIHSIGMPEVVEAVPQQQEERHDLAARALFAATEVVIGNRFQTEAGKSIPQTKQSDYDGRYRSRLLAQLKASPASVTGGGREIQDAWGTKVRIERLSWAPREPYYEVRSAGPDKQFNTGDDLDFYVEARGRKPVGKASSGASAIEVHIEHDRGPFNGRAEVVGSVIDQHGGAVEGAVVTLKDLTTGVARTAKAGADGRFRQPAVPAGDYEIQASNGSETVSRKLSLKVRDSAVVSVFLRHQAGGLTVAEIGIGRGFGVGGGFGGGVMGGVVRARPMMMMAPMAAPRPGMAVHQSMGMVRNSAMVVMRDAAAEPAPRVRSYFPEALYINPEIITDGNGNATISIPLADSITTWRMAMMASTKRGALGSGASSIKVFQDFFVDLDLPVTLTQGDRVSIPVAVYNYAGARGDVSLALKSEDWFTLVNDRADKTVTVESGRVGGAQYTLQAQRIGKFKLTLAAKMAGNMGRADIVVREIEVVPDGREQNVVFNGRLETAVQHDVQFPQASIPEAATIFVRLYPGPLSQVIEGMDAILRMPGGCFEQTSSSTYPNVLALDYMKRTGKLTPEVHAKAEGFIANGYQRLLTFEVPGGGFSWFGNPPANKILTSYGLMEFGDMAKVYDVDPKLIARTQQWLAGQQQGDGSWKPDTQFINEGATNRYNTDVLRITAYIAWALRNTGFQGPAVEKAKQYVESHMSSGKADTYTLAVIANFAADYGRDREFTNRAVQTLVDARTEQGEQAWWSAEETSVYARGASAAVETTGLAVQALLKSGIGSAAARKALAYIAAKKDASGTWGTTQATIMALRAVLLSTEKGAADVRGKVEITLDGKPVQELNLMAENNDLLHQFVFKNVDAKAAHHVAIRFVGKGGLAYQVVGRYFVPWGEGPADEPLSIAVNYDRTKLVQDDLATATATIKNNLTKVANMVMVDLGIPPGFDLLSEDLQAIEEKTAGQKGGRLEKFSMTATQAILYFDSLAPGAEIQVQYRLRAKYPIRARTFQSRVWEYYEPDVKAAARPVVMEVGRK